MPPPCAPHACRWGPRLGLIQVRSQEGWERLASAVPAITHNPRFGQGVLIGVVCWAGTPLDGRWPVHIQRIRMEYGAALVEVDFRTGSYFPDGTARLEIVHVDLPSPVLAVEVNGTTFFTQEAAARQ